MADTIRRKGNPDQVSFTPSSGNVAAGQVVLVGNLTGWTCGIAPLAITNNVQGVLDNGEGVYEVINLDNAANGAKVWWDNTNKKVTTTSTNNALFGFVVEKGSGGANTICYAIHKPYV